MKRIILLAILLLSMVTLALADIPSKPQDVTATISSQSPDPVEPGEVVTVKFKIENDGKQTFEDAIVRVLPQFPFKVYGSSPEKNIGKLRSSSTGADAEIVEFKIKVDEAAVEGETEIELEIELGTTVIQYINDELLIDIETRDAVLDITSITSSPAQIPPGGTSEVSVMVKNLADSLLRDIHFDLDLSKDSLPLAPYQSSSKKILDQLDSNQQNALIFNIIADPEAAPGLYKVPVNITYSDEKGNAYLIEETLALSVGDAPSIKPFIKKSSVLKKNSAGTLTLGLANAGTTDVKFVEVYLLPSEDYQLISTSDYIYIGDVDSDDTESEEIEIFINRKAKTLDFPIRLKYYDANNKPFQQQFNLEMNLYSSSQLKKFGLVESSSSGFIFFLIIVGGGGYWFYRKKGYIPFVTNFMQRFRKKKKHTSHHGKK